MVNRWSRRLKRYASLVVCCGLVGAGIWVAWEELGRGERAAGGADGSMYGPARVPAETQDIALAVGESLNGGRTELNREARELIAQVGAARAGAEVSLGVLYLSGQLGRADDVEAARWIDVAADAGNPYGLYLRMRMREEGRVSGSAEENMKDAARLVALAAGEGDLELRVAALMERLLALPTVETPRSISTKAEEGASAVAPSASDETKTTGVPGDGLVNDLVAELRQEMAAGRPGEGVPPARTEAFEPATVDFGSGAGADGENVVLNGGADGEGRLTQDASATSGEGMPPHEGPDLVVPETAGVQDEAPDIATDPTDIETGVAERIGVERAGERDAETAQREEAVRTAAEEVERLAEERAREEAERRAAENVAAEKAAAEKAAAEQTQLARRRDAAQAARLVEDARLAAIEAEAEERRATAATEAPADAAEVEAAADSEEAPAPVEGEGDTATSTPAQTGLALIEAAPPSEAEKRRLIEVALAGREGAAVEPAPVAPASRHSTEMTEFQRMVAEAQAQRAQEAQAGDPNGPVAEEPGVMVNSAGQTLSEIPQSGPDIAALQRLALAQSGLAGDVGSNDSPYSAGALLVAKSSNPALLLERFEEIAKEHPAAMSDLEPDVRQVQTQSGMTFVLAIYGFHDGDHLRQVCEIFGVKRCEVQP